MKVCIHEVIYNVDVIETFSLFNCRPHNILNADDVFVSAVFVIGMYKGYVRSMTHTQNRNKYVEQRFEQEYVPEVTQQFHFPQRASGIYQVFESICNFLDCHLLSGLRVLCRAYNAIGTLANCFDRNIFVVNLESCSPNLVGGLPWHGTIPLHGHVA